MDTVDILERRAEEMFSKVGNWQKNALRRIGRRVKDIGKLSYADLQAINNATIVGRDVNAIMKELAELTGQNIRDVQKIYAEMIEQQHEGNRVLYDYRKKKFVPFAENRELQALVRAYSRITAESFVGLTMSKAKNIGFVNKAGKFVPIESNFINILDKAVMSVATGAGTFHQEMRDAIMQLGGSGLRVDYGNGITRSIDSMVRQNLLWGAKQASVEYNEMIGEELGCDGIEIDWHSNPRPQHEFMQGKQYVLGKARTINGIYFESADKALDALQDYGCLHFKTPIICGVSEPTYTPEELARLNALNARRIEIDGVSKTGYEWKQTMRRLEREGRSTSLQRETLKSEGDIAGARNLDIKMQLIEEKYSLIAEKTGVKAQTEKMRLTPVSRGNIVVDVDGTSLDYMSKNFRPELSEEISTVTAVDRPFTVRRVENSEFGLYAEDILTKRSKSVRLTEKNIKACTEFLPEWFELPEVLVVDFGKNGITVDAIAGYDRKTGYMLINSRYEKAEQILGFVQKSPGYFANQTEYAPYLHEFGHKYYMDCVKSIANLNKIGYNEAEGRLEDLIAAFIHRKNGEKVFLEDTIGRKAMLEYSAHNYTEVVAECFSVYSTSDYAKELIDLIRS